MIVRKIQKDEHGMSVDKYIKKLLMNAPLSFIYKIERNKDIKVNGNRVNKSFILSTNDEVMIYITDKQFIDFHEEKKNISTKQDISSWIIYEDDGVLLINKPRGVLVQKDKSNENSLVEMVDSYLFNRDHTHYSIGPVHRLDRNTSGIVIFSKSYEVSREFSFIINDKKIIEKYYLALVKGKMESYGEINKPLLKRNDGSVVVDENGKEAITKYKVISSNEDYSLVELQLLTGRTHQIRVHLSSIGHPIIGDNKYGDFELNHFIEKEYKFKNQFLKAYKIKFNKVGGILTTLCDKTFMLSLDNDMEGLLDSLKLSNK